MPRKEGQKLKLLTLLEIFVRETDEKHPISVPRMVELLKERGIVAERKSVYDDIQTLNEMPDTPFEIVQQRGRGGGYYMVDAPYELAELKPCTAPSPRATRCGSNTVTGTCKSRWCPVMKASCTPSAPG
mgnify:CR=1 FL=1